MNWADQQPGESRAHWKERTFAMHYGMGRVKLRDLFEQQGRMPQPGDTFTFDFGSRTSGRMPPPSAEHQYRGRPDNWQYRAWPPYENLSRAEELINSISDWDQLGVELPELIMVPTSTDEGVFVITQLEA